MHSHFSQELAKELHHDQWFEPINIVQTADHA